MIKRTIECHICGKQETEESYGKGWQDWGKLQGKQDDKTGDIDAHLCPEHTIKMYEYLEGLKNDVD